VYSAIHVGSCRKIQDRRQIESTDNTQIKHPPPQKQNLKYTNTKLSWFSRLIQLLTRKWGWAYSTRSQAHMGHDIPHTEVKRVLMMTTTLAQSVTVKNNS